jgi:putative peptidoglycan lipid II flippase
MGRLADQPLRSRLRAATLLMTVAVFASRIIGYLREAFIAARFGANGATDAFYAAFTFPDFLNYLVAGGTLSITLLPIYARHLAEGDETEADRVLGVVATLMLLVVGVGVVLGELGAEPLVATFFHDLAPDARAACVRMTRVLFPAQIFFFAGGLASATLFARGRFAAAALAPLLYNVGIIAGGVALGGVAGPEGLVWGALVGAAVGPFLIPAIGAYRAGARPRPSLAARDPGFIEWVKLSLPLMIGVSLVTADDWIIRYFASGASGAITRLTYAKRLVAVPIAVAGQAVGQASMPFFARLFAEGKRDELIDTFAATTRGAAVVSLLVAAYLIAVPEPVVTVLFARGRFGLAEVPATATYLTLFAAAVPLWAVQGIVARVFYAARNTLTPMLAGSAVTLLSLPVYAVLDAALGPAGLALASGIGILGHTAVLAWLAPRIVPGIGRGVASAARGVAAAALLAVLAGGAAWAVGRFAAPWLPFHGQAAALATCALAGVAFTAVVALLGAPLGIDEPRRLWRRLRRRRGSTPNAGA